MQDNNQEEIKVDLHVIQSQVSSLSKRQDKIEIKQEKFEEKIEDKQERFEGKIEERQRIMDGMYAKRDQANLELINTIRETNARQGVMIANQGEVMKEIKIFIEKISDQLMDLKQADAQQDYNNLNNRMTERASDLTKKNAAIWLALTTTIGLVLGIAQYFLPIVLKYFGME